MIILSMEKSKSLQKLFTNTGGRNGLGKACCLKTDFSCRPFLFYEKEMVHTPKKKAAQTFAEHFCLRRRKILLSTRRSAFGADMFPSGGACVWHLGRAPQRGLNLSRKHHSLPPQAGRRTARFFTSFPGAGSRGNLPQAFGKAFFFCSRNRFCLGPSKKK